MFEIYNRNYTKLNEGNFLNDVKNFEFILKIDDTNQNDDFLTNIFINIVNNHAPLKKKFIRGNQAPFMIRNLSKEIYTKSSFRNEKLYKKQRNKCVALRRKCIKEYFHNISNNNIVTNKIFWNFTRPFLVNKGLLNSSKITPKKRKENYYSNVFCSHPVETFSIYPFLTNK